MTFEESLLLLSDEQIEHMKRRSHTRAALAWSEARAWAIKPNGNTMAAMIGAEAFSEEQFWNALVREQSRRAAERRVPA